MSHNAKTRGAPLQLESRWGWSDYRAGRPYRPEYETWSRIQQRNYENGRLRAANVKAAFGNVPSQQTRFYFHEAAHRVGYAEPVGPRGYPRW